MAVIFQCLDPDGPDICKWPEGVECWVGVYSMLDLYTPLEPQPLNETELFESGFSQAQIKEIVQNHESPQILPARFYLHLVGERAPTENLDAVDASVLKKVLTNIIGPFKRQLVIIDGLANRLFESAGIRDATNLGFIYTHAWP